jgi:cold shock CspA family protein
LVRKKKKRRKYKSKKRKKKKREERKANSKKGASLDEMMAYVDENGNISSTPPDPSKRRVVNQEDIVLGVPKQAEPDPADLIRTGTVTFFNDAKGFGFIKDSTTQESIFVHVNNLSQAIKENDKVTFEVEKGMKGPIAVRVSIITA